MIHHWPRAQYHYLRVQARFSPPREVVATKEKSAHVERFALKSESKQHIQLLIPQPWKDKHHESAQSTEIYWHPVAGRSSVARLRVNQRRHRESIWRGQRSVGWIKHTRRERTNSYKRSNADNACAIRVAAFLAGKFDRTRGTDYRRASQSG